MEPYYVYPGTFSPPTYGHLHLVERAAALFPHVTIICSENPDKQDAWFNPTETKHLWDSYQLPTNVSVLTLQEFVSAGISRERIVMIRGIRGKEDAEAEKDVLIFNHERFGIEQFVYLVSKPEFRRISSTAARRAAEQRDFAGLKDLVAPLIVTGLLEHVGSLKNLILVVGRPASGKSTLLRALTALDPSNVHIETDTFLHELRPELQARFPGQELAQLALEREDELKAVIGPLWLERVHRALSIVPKGATVFLEVAYAMQPDKSLFRYFGGKILSVGCAQDTENRRRVHARGTPEHAPFINRIPDMVETRRIATEQRLALISILTDSAPIEQIVKNLLAQLNGGDSWKLSLSA
ncbi:MAG: adenylyltransferase/cytidyltransferase family protein [bacterium]|nr:adenylyltransferase/cytidyltransferase family protein [bacterium]